jgi:hypothetical protein
VSIDRQNQIHSMPTAPAQPSQSEVLSAILNGDLALDLADFGRLGSRNTFDIADCIVAYNL